MCVSCGVCVCVCGCVGVWVCVCLCEWLCGLWLYVCPLLCGLCGLVRKGRSWCDERIVGGVFVSWGVWLCSGL